jgi:hypothetical protein
MRLLQAKRLSDIQTPLRLGECGQGRIALAYLDRAAIVPRFDALLGTDDRLPLEYVTIAQYGKSFVPPDMPIMRVPGMLVPFIDLKIEGDC